MPQSSSIGLGAVVSSLEERVARHLRDERDRHALHRFHVGTSRRSRTGSGRACTGGRRGRSGCAAAGYQRKSHRQGQHDCKCFFHDMTSCFYIERGLHPPSGEHLILPLLPQAAPFLFSGGPAVQPFSGGLPQRGTTTTISRMPMGISRYCVFTLKHSGMPKRIRPMIGEARRCQWRCPCRLWKCAAQHARGDDVHGKRAAKVTFRGAQGMR